MNSRHEKRINFGVLQDANFRRYFVGQGLSIFGDTLVPLALAFAVLKLTGSAAALGFVLLASRVPLTLFTLIGGEAGDRLPRRRIMLAADGVRMIAHGVTAALLLTGAARLWHLIVLQVASGVAAAFFDPAASGLIRAVVAEDKLTNANAFLGLSRSTIAVFAIAASGSLVATVGAGWAFAANSASFAASAWFLLRLGLPVGERTPTRPDFIAQIAEGFGYVRSRRWLVVTITYMALLNGAVIAPLMVLGPTVARSHLGGATSWAAVLIATALGSIVGSMVSLRMYLRFPLAAALGAVFAAVPFAALLAVAGPIWSIAACAVLFGAQSSFSNITITSLIQRQVATEAISRVTSYLSLGSLLFAPFGFALAGVAAERWGTASVLWCSAAWVLLSTIAALSFPDVRAIAYDANPPSALRPS